MITIYNIKTNEYMIVNCSYDFLYDLIKDEYVYEPEVVKEDIWRVGDIAYDFIYDRISDNCPELITTMIF